MRPNVRRTGFGWFGGPDCSASMGEEHFEQQLAVVDMVLNDEDRQSASVIAGEYSRFGRLAIV
jgi:hypothetical protein